MLAHAQCRPGTPHTDAHMRRSTIVQSISVACRSGCLVILAHAWYTNDTDLHTRVNYSLDPLRPSILRRWFLTTMLYVTMILHNIVTMRRSARIEVFSLDTDVHTYILTIGSFVELSTSAKNS